MASLGKRKMSRNISLVLLICSCIILGLANADQRQQQRNPKQNSYGYQQQNYGWNQQKHHYPAPGRYGSGVASPRRPTVPTVSPVRPSQPKRYAIPPEVVGYPVITSSR